MILDNALMFTGTSNKATGGVTSGPYTDSPTTGTQASSNVIDLSVVGGLPDSSRGGGARDLGIGDDPALKLLIAITTSFSGTTSLEVKLVGAPDNGTGAPGTWTSMWTTGAVALASLVAGNQLANVTVPRPAIGQAMPRFLALSYVTTGTSTAGALEGTIVLDKDDQPVGSTGAYSGYPAGITIVN